MGMSEEIVVLQDILNFHQIILEIPMIVEKMNIDGIARKVVSKV